MAKKIVTPKGASEWAYLFSPDTKFDADGAYRLNLKVPADKAAALCATLDDLVEEQWQKVIEEQPKLKNKLQKVSPYEEDLNDNGDPTGDLVFKFKQKARVTARSGKVYEIKPKVFDAKGKPITQAINLGNGSIVKVAFEPSPYFVAATKSVGVSLRGFDVQVIKIEEYGSGSSSVFGQEEGYEYEEIEAGEDFDTEEEDLGEDDDF